tara:strand:- start:80 stop:685 length:606 start_codon:yes stop_codon:yes gene_type:complete
MELVKYNNNSISSVTALASMASGDLNLITTNTISSGVSSSSFTSNINSTYDTYLFKWINCHPATADVNFTVNFRDGSSAFDATKTTILFHAQHAESGSDSSLSYRTGEDLAQSTDYQYLGYQGNDNDQVNCGEMFLFSPSSTTFVKHFIARVSNQHPSEYARNIFMSGYCNTTSAIDGVDFKFSSGNIDSGVIKMYGLSKS